MATRVLVVDDAAFMRQSIRLFLEKNGFEVVGEGVNGADGFEKFKDLKPDLVTMDITMPEVTGIEGVKMIMAHDPSAKVVMISAMGQEHMVKEAILAGARSFIVKPFQEDHFVQTLKKIAGI